MLSVLRYLLLTSLYDLSNKDLRETCDYLRHRLGYLLTQCLLDQLVKGAGQ